jgi:hypothetical protein
VRVVSGLHTEGPWATRRSPIPDNTGGYDVAIVADGKVIAECFEHVGYAGDGRTYDCRPVYANARLIAAAPDLLKACVDWITWLRPSSPWREDAAEYEENMLHAMRAAIAKAGATS